MVDGIGRSIDYMRISVTDRCNLRCRYCMPEEGLDMIAHEDVLSFEEMERICRIGVSLGINKIKLTGGEPLVRKGILEFIGRLKCLEGIEDITLTTNGVLLAKMAHELKKRGISSVNVSLDSFQKERFYEITRRDRYEEVRKGIEAAIQAGLRVKLNCAVMEDLNKDEILEFAAFAFQRGISVRFIEMMPIGEGRGYRGIDNDRLLEIISEEYPELKPVEDKLGNGPAVYYGLPGTIGYIGFISAVHHKFCSGCNRVRLTSGGFLKLCLAREEGLDLKSLLRRGEEDSVIQKEMEAQIRQKPSSHHFERIAPDTKDKVTMNQIGG